MPPLVAHWPLQEDSGSTAHDVRGGNDGTLNGGVTQGASGILGTTAYDFDGTDDYVDLPTSITGSGVPITVSFWFQLDNHGTWDTLLSNYDGSSGMICGVDDNNGTFRFWADGTEIQGPSITTGSWILYTAQVEADGTMRLYFDGEEVAQGSTTTAVDTAETIRLARRPSGDYPTDVKLADVRVYDHALTPAEVQYLYSVGQRATAVSEVRSL